MNQLTRKYVFECVLKGERIRIHSRTFADRKLIRKCGIISKIDKTGACYILHDIAIHNPPTEQNPVWRTHSMDAGTMLVNMGRVPVID